MLPCPRCRKPLSRATAGALDHWVCRACEGRAATFGRLQKVLPAEFVARARTAADEPGWRGDLRCPICTVHMVPFRVTYLEHEYALDRCRDCRLVWFDRGEHEAAEGHEPAPPAPDPVHDGPRRRGNYEGRVDHADIEIAPYRFRGDSTDALSLLGFPVPDAPSFRGRPWAAVLLAAAVGVVGAWLLLFGHERLIADLSFAPAHPLRHRGRDLLTFFFVHEEAWQLAVHLYFLAVAGTWVEDVLGPARFLLLVALSAFAGALVLVVATQGSAVPVGGAAGGVSGILAYGALAHPNARLRLAEWGWYRFLELRFTARAAFVVWIALHLAGAFLLGEHGVDHWMPLGGAAAGILAWCLGAEGPWAWRKGPAGVPVP